jgi:cell division protein FtsZ
MTFNEEGMEVIPTTWGKKAKDKIVIKVLGVGGGGCNAINYMFNNKVEGCSFYVCNTDSQSLSSSPVPTKIQIGEGLGAGCDPRVGRNAALDAQNEICEKVLDNKTDMLFITAGMGGGTGTGAAPVIASMAKEKNILTVGVVTLPFRTEGNDSMARAIDGIYELQKNVDSILIINNEKIYEHFNNMLIQDAFPKTDEVLKTAVQSITEIINKPGYVNVDFRDVKSMMTNSGMALMGCGTGSGKDRIKKAVADAVKSPLLNEFDIKTAKNVLLNVTAGYNEQGLLMEDLAMIDKLLEEEFGEGANRFKRGIVYETDQEFGDKVKITVIATGFEMKRLNDIANVKLGNIIMIDSDFEYTKEVALNAEEEDSKEVFSQKIGFNNAAIKKSINIGANGIPALLVGETDAKGPLESIAAIRRRAK